MPSGILGRNNLTAAANTVVYTVPANTVTSASVSFCNRNSSAALIRLAVTDNVGGIPNDTDWFLFDVSLPGNAALERTGLVLETGEKIVVRSSIANVTSVVYGYEGT